MEQIQMNVPQYKTGKTLNLSYFFGHQSILRIWRDFCTRTARLSFLHHSPRRLILVCRSRVICSNKGTVWVNKLNWITSLFNSFSSRYSWTHHWCPSWSGVEPPVCRMFAQFMSGFKYIVLHSKENYRWEIIKIQIRN